MCAVPIPEAQPEKSVNSAPSVKGDDPNAPKSQAFINYVTKRIHYAELDLSYERTKSVQDNAVALGISPTTLYRYCSDRYIETNPGKGQTYVQKRQAKKQDKADKKATFMLYYDPNLSAAKNREKMLQYGLDVSVGTIRNWGKEYAMPSIRPRIVRKCYSMA